MSSAQILPLVRPIPRQLQLLRSRSSRLLFLAGVGSGKTHGLCYWALRKSLRQPGVNGALFAPSFRLFRRVVLPKWRELAPPGIYRWKEADQAIELSNGTTIYCMGIDRAVERVVGLNLGWAGLDEAGVCKDDMIPKLIMQRCRVGDPSERQVALFTSPHGYGWLRDWSGQQTRGGRRIVDVITSTTYDNPYLPREYIEDLEIDFPPGTPMHSQELLGEFIVVAGLYYDLFSRDEHCVDISFDVDRPYDLGWDPGARRSGVVALQECHGLRVAVREWVQDGEFTDDTARRIQADLGYSPRRIALDTPSKLNTRTNVTDVEALHAVFGPRTTITVVSGERRKTKYRHRAVTSAFRRRRLAVSRDLIPSRITATERGLVHALEALPWADVSLADERPDDKNPLKHVVDALEFDVALTLPPSYYDSEDRARELDRRGGRAA